MSWKSRLRDLEFPPDLSAEEASKAIDALKERELMLPTIDYAEDLMTLAAQQRDGQDGSSACRTALNTARTDESLKKLYSQGTAAGKHQSTLPANQKYNKSLRAITPLVLEKFGRYRIESYTFFQGPRSHRYMQQSTVAMERIHTSKLSDIMKAITLGELALAGTGAVIKDRANTYAERLMQIESVPENFFSKYYRGDQTKEKPFQEPGTMKRIAYHEVFSVQLNSLYREKFNEEQEALGRSAIGAALYMQTSKKQLAYSLWDTKLEILAHVDQGNFQAAHKVLFDLYIRYPELFNDIARAYIEANTPPTTEEAEPEPITRTSQREYYGGLSTIDGRAAEQYCARVLKLEPEKIEARAKSLQRSLFGVLKPPADKRTDIVYVTDNRLASDDKHRTDSYRMQVYYYAIQPETSSLEKLPSGRGVNPATIVAHAELLFTELATDIDPAEVTNREAEWISKLHAARSLADKIPPE